jgi:hypothetical protein
VPVGVACEGFWLAEMQAENALLKRILKRFAKKRGANTNLKKN